MGSIGPTPFPSSACLMHACVCNCKVPDSHSFPQPHIHKRARMLTAAHPQRRQQGATCHLLLLRLRDTTSKPCLHIEYRR